MATETANRSVHNTLNSTNPDTITINGGFGGVEVTNWHTSEYLYVRQDGTTAVAAANNTTKIGPASSKILKYEELGSVTGIVLSIIGNGNDYSVEGVS